MSAFVAYHGIGAGEHQQRVDELLPQGYRPVSLSVSGDPGDPRFAAVWLQRPGPELEMVHGLDEAAYQQRFSEITGRGLVPVSVSATGRAGDACFAAWFERLDMPRWFARHSIGLAELIAENERALTSGYIARSLAVYGTGGDQRFAGVWLDNTEVDGGPVPWCWWFSGAAEHQNRFDAALRGGLRLSHVAMSADGGCLAVARDQPIGEFWARHAHHRRGVPGRVRRANRAGADADLGPGRWVEG